MSDVINPSGTEPISLRAGPLSLSYQAGDLRYVRLDEREIVRRVLVAVRDRNWGTVPNRLSNVHVEAGTNWFQIQYDSVSRHREIDFSWHATLGGNAQGSLTFAFEGVAHSTFWRNRLGLIVLHPIRECAGAPCRVEQDDGRRLESAFPHWVSPTHPFEDLRAIAYRILPDLWAELRFEGDIFEMEDQRNWTDASFKTYSTPLRLGFPKEVLAGARIAQSVTLKLLGAVPSITTASAAAPVLSVGSRPVGRLPRLGVGLASHGQPLAPSEMARLRALRLSHLRADLRLDSAEWPATLERAAHEARELGAGLELALHLPAEPRSALKQLRAQLNQLPLTSVTWLIFNASGAALSADQISLVRHWLNGAAATARWVGGTNAYFMELNSRRPPVDGLDGVCYSINPQIHAFDTASLMETFEAQAATVLSVGQFAPGLPVSITPLTLRPRFNAVATGPEPERLPGELPPPVDARQMRLEAAAWTVGSLGALAATGAVASLTLYETTGWRGVMETENGSPLPQAFPSVPGQVFPVYHVLADLAAWPEAEVLPVACTQPLKAAGLAWRQGSQLAATIANLTDYPQRVTLAGIGPRARVHYLDETNVQRAAENPDAYRTEPGQLVTSAAEQLTLALGPYGLARLTAE